MKQVKILTTRLRKLIEIMIFSRELKGIGVD